MKRLSIRFIPRSVFKARNVPALSRLIVLEENYDRVVERLLGPPPVCASAIRKKPSVVVGPVIDEAAYRRILDYLEVGKSEATLAYQAKGRSVARLFHSTYDFHRSDTRHADRARGDFRPSAKRD